VSGDRDDAPPDARELADAQRFARLVDDVVAGAPPPAALDVEQRALLDAAALLRPLGAARRDSLVDAAFAGARPGRRRRLVLPAGAAALLFAAAAALLLLVRRPAPPLPEAQRSRPADALVGPIARAQSGDARARADLLYADRLAGYRQRTLRGAR
jgi:hypothetical protein